MNTHARTPSLNFTVPLHGPLRHAVVMAGVVVAGCIGPLATAVMTSPRGATGPSVLQSHAPFASIATVIAVFAVLAALAAGIGRLTNVIVGMFVLGAGVGAMAFMTAGATELAFSETAVLPLVGIETLLLAALTLAAGLAVFRLAGPMTDIEPDDAGRTAGARSFVSLQAAACGIIILVAIWVLAQSPMRTQAIMAVFIGGMFTGLAGRLFFLRAHPLPLFISPIVLIGLAWIVLAIVADIPLDAAYINDELNPILTVMPLDAVGGSLMGVSIGIGWARSFIHTDADNCAGH